MDKFVKRKSVPSSVSVNEISEEIIEPSLKRNHTAELDLTCLLADPGLRMQISQYHPNVQDIVRREYLLKGPCQPNHDFPQTLFGKKLRRFNFNWFKEYGSWLEYSVSKDAAFCLYCFLFKQKGSSVFVDTGFSNWKHKEKIQEHVGGIGSYHNEAFMKCENLMRQKQHIKTVICKQTDQSRVDYKARLVASIKVIRLLLEEGLPFRGHDETRESKNPGHFLAILKFLAGNNEEVNRVVLDNAPGNLKLIAPTIQKDIVNACASETIIAIINDIGDALFSILADESRDISIKEQMVVAIRYVDKQGFILERVIGFVHVKETTSLSLKKAIDDLLSKNGLSITKLRGQGYDGASNMQGELNGLKTLILKENKHAFFVHCFAHQLQLTLVAIAKNHRHVSNFFDLVSETVTLVGASCKRNEEIKEKQYQMITEGINNGEILTGRGLNQETSLKRPGTTRWGSHYETLLRFISMYSAVIGVLNLVDEDGWFREQRAKAMSLRDVATNLLLSMACLSPLDSFSAFNKERIVSLAQVYTEDFSTLDVLALEDQLDVYIIDMRSNIDFSGLHGISELSRKMVESKKHVTYPLVYLLITLSLILPVATASVERAFSAMHHVKTCLRNRMGDEWMSDSLVTYIERDVFISIDIEKIIERFQNMKTRRGELP